MQIYFECWYILTNVTYNFFLTCLLFWPIIWQTCLIFLLKSLLNWKACVSLKLLPIHCHLAILIGVQVSNDSFRISWKIRPIIFLQFLILYVFCLAILQSVLLEKARRLVPNVFIRFSLSYSSLYAFSWNHANFFEVILLQMLLAWK